MAGLLDFFSGGSDADLYGGLLSEAQRRALATRGLASMAEKFGQLAMPQRAPIPLGAILGQGFGAYGAGTDEALKTAFEAQYKAAQAQKLQSEIEYAKQSGPAFDKIIQALYGINAPGGAAAMPGSGSSGGAAVSPSAGGGGGPGRLSYDQVHQLVLDQGFPPDKAPTMTAIIMAESGGNPGAKNLNPSDPGGSYGLTQINQGAHGPKALEALNNPARAIQLAYDISNGGTNFAPWSAYKSGAYKQFLRQPGTDGGGAAPSAAAPAPAGGGGLLNLPDPTGTGARAGFGLPQGAGLLAAPAPGESINNTANRILKGWTAGSGGGQGAPLDDPYAGYPTTAEEAGGGDAPMATAPIPPRPAPPPLAIPDLPPQAAAALAQAVPNLLRGGGGPLSGAIPGMPPAAAAAPDAMPSDDPRLQFGPLAPAPAAAPAAAAAAAPGPGLLAPGALPGTAAPIPRGVNPAYGQVATAIAAAALQASRAGMPTAPFTMLLDSLKSNPAYQAEVKRGEEGVKLEYAPAMAEATKAVELRYAGAIAAAIANGQLPSQLVLHSLDAQNAVKASLAAKGLVGQFDAGGNLTYTSRIPGQDIADTAAKAAEARGTGQGELVTVLRQGPNGPYEVQIPRTQYIDELNQGAPPSAGTPAPPGTLLPGRAPGPGSAAAPGAAPIGGLVGKPYFTPEEIASQASDQKRLDTMQANAQASRLAIQNANDTRQLIERGVITGAGADSRTQLLKLGQVLKLTGKDDNDLIANTEAFIAQQGKAMKSALAGLGPPVSDRDQLTADRIAGGQNLTVQGLLELKQIEEKYHRQALADYNQLAEKAPPSRYPRLINEPPTYGAKTATGPNGQRMWEKSPGNWVAF